MSKPTLFLLDYFIGTSNRTISRAFAKILTNDKETLETRNGAFLALCKIGVHPRPPAELVLELYNDENVSIDNLPNNLIFVDWQIIDELLEE